jgi:hypothetical protein
MSVSISSRFPEYTESSLKNIREEISMFSRTVAMPAVRAEQAVTDCPHQ